MSFRAGLLGALLAAAFATGPGSASAAPLTTVRTETAACESAAAYSEARRGVSLLVLRDGKPLCERYAADVAASDAFPIHSGTKSLVGVMAAAAVQDRLLTLDEPVAGSLSEWRGDPQLAAITHRQLLSLTSGLDPGRVGRPPSFAEAVAVRPLAEPGRRFAYGPAPFQVFGAVLARKLAASGRSPDVLAYLEQRIAGPIGVRWADWSRADGDPNLAGGAVMTARDWSRFGEFVRRGGRQGSKRLVEAAAFEAQFDGSRANPAYGLTWWLPRPVSDPDLRMPGGAFDIVENAGALPPDLVMAAGAGDQRLYVIPSLRLTIVRQARVDRAAIARALAAGRTQERPATARAWSDAEFLKLLLR